MRKFWLAIFSTLFLLTTTLSADTFRVKPYQLQKEPGSVTHIDHFVPSETATVEYTISVEGGDYLGWDLKRITLSAPEGLYISGSAKYDESSSTLTLDKSGYRSNSVTLDMLSSFELSTIKQQAYMRLFPVDLNGKEFTLSYILQSKDGSERVVLHNHQKGGNNFFKAGQEHTIEVILPEKADGVVWIAEEWSSDIDYYKEEVLALIKRAGLPSMQVCYTSPLEKISFVVVNEEFYKKAPVQESSPLSTISMYECASISKPVFAFMAMQLNERGEIDFDTPLWEYYPGLLDFFEEKDREKAKLLTGRICLNHKTGLNNRHYAKARFLYDVGTQNYSGPGIFYLQRTIQHIKGETLVELAKKMVFKPLGMTYSSYRWEPEYDKIGVIGYYRDGTWRGRKKWRSEGNSAFTLRSNAEEISIFLNAMMNQYGLSSEKHHEWLSPQTSEHMVVANKKREEQRAFRTLGFVRENNEEFGRVIYHGGNNRNFRGLAMFIEERGITLTYFVNGQHNYEMNDHITELFLKYEKPFSMFGGGKPLPR